MRAPLNSSDLTSTFPSLLFGSTQSFDTLSLSRCNLPCFQAGKGIISNNTLTWTVGVIRMFIKFPVGMAKADSLFALLGRIGALLVEI